MTLKSEAETSNALFSGFINGKPSALAYTIFPAPSGENKIDLSNRNAADGQLDAPMIATFDPTDLNTVSFKNGCALVKLPISGLSSAQTLKLGGGGIGGNLVPYLNTNTNKWELVYDGTAGNAIVIDNVDNGDLLIPVATSQNNTNNVNNTPADEKVTLEVSIGTGNPLPVGEVTIQNGKITDENEVPKIKVEENGEIVVEVDTPEKLIAAVAAGGNIKLTNNIAVTQVLEVSKSICIEGDKKTITLEGEEKKDQYGYDDNRLFEVEKDITLELNNLDLEGTGYLVLSHEGDIILNNVNATETGNQSGIECHGGTLDIKSGAYVNTSFSFGYMVVVIDGCVANLRGAEIGSEEYTTGGLTVQYSSTANLYDCQLNTNSGKAQEGLHVVASNITYDEETSYNKCYVQIKGEISGTELGESVINKAKFNKTTLNGNNFRGTQAETEQKIEEILKR